MPTTLFCLFIAILIPNILALAGSIYRVKFCERFDNCHPRQQVATLQGTGARIYAAQYNAWEALIIFAPAIIIVHLFNADLEKASIAAIVWLGLRTIHAIAYILNWPAIRSAVATPALLCALYLFALPFWF